MSNSHRFHVALPTRQWAALTLISDKVQLTVSDVVRSMVERSLAEDQLHQIYPSMSGQLTGEGK